MLNVIASCNNATYCSKTMRLLAMALNSIDGSYKKPCRWKLVEDLEWFLPGLFFRSCELSSERKKTTNGSLVTHCYLPSPISYPNSSFYFHLLCGGTLPVPAQEASRIESSRKDQISPGSSQIRSPSSFTYLFSRSDSWPNYK